MTFNSYMNVSTLCIYIHVSTVPICWDALTEHLRIMLLTHGSGGWEFKNKGQQICCLAKLCSPLQRWTAMGLFYNKGAGFTPWS